MNTEQFARNRANFSAHELEKYAGKYVAWSPDGSAIVASDEDERRIDARIKAAGYDPSALLVSFIPQEDEVVLGGGGIVE